VDLSTVPSNLDYAASSSHEFFVPFNENREDDPPFGSSSYFDPPSYSVRNLDQGRYLLTASAKFDPANPVTRTYELAIMQGAAVLVEDVEHRDIGEGHAVTLSMSTLHRIDASNQSMPIRLRVRVWSGGLAPLEMYEANLGATLTSR
jgi:hypothetical protein